MGALIEAIDWNIVIKVGGFLLCAAFVIIAPALVQPDTRTHGTPPPGWKEDS